MLAKHLEKKNDESGFTLVELLVVILIIGILAAIAIPAFLNQRQRANDASVESDVRNVATAIETMLIGEPNASTVGPGTYTADSVTVTVGGESQDVNLSDGVSIRVTVDGTDGNTRAANGYLVEGYHSNGSQYTSSDALEYRSASGGF